MPATIPRPDDMPDPEAVKKLVATVDRFKRHQGPFHASPLFGVLDRETLEKLQLIHCAHHLSFLVPEKD
jgi:hypothetical protein